MSGNTTPLNEFVTLQRGHDLPQSDRIAGKIPVIASTGIAGYHNEAKAKAPGVVIGRSGSIGGGQYITENFWPLNTTLWVKDFKGHNERFVYYLFKNIDFTTFNVGTGVPTLNRNHLSSILIANFGRGAENKIAKILGDLDDKIALNTQINQTLEAMAQALFKSWFVNFDPVKAKFETRANGGDDNAVRRAAMTVISGKSADELQQFKQKNPEAFAKLAETADLFPERMVESELGEIPEGWEVKSLSAICNPTKGKNITKQTVVEGEVPVVAGGLTPAYYHNQANVFGPVVTVSASGANAGFVNLYHQDIWASDCSYISSNETEYIYSIYTLLKYKQDEITHMQQGAAQPHVYPKDLNRLNIAISPKIMWVAIESTLSSLYLKIKNNIQANINLAATRDVLLPKLLSGEIDLTKKEHYDNRD